jgi:hypothetical protein
LPARSVARIRALAFRRFLLRSARTIALTALFWNLSVSFIAFPAASCLAALAER